MLSLGLQLFKPKGIQIRNAVSNFRPKKMKYKKAFKGTYSMRPLSLRGTTVYFGDYGLQMLEGGRLTDKQLDVARAAIRKAIKPEKEAKFILRCFPDRPVTRKAAETRMGKGKGAVDYFASWVSKGRVIFEVKGAREEIARRALKIAGAYLGLRTRIICRDDSMRMAPRVLPHFIKQRLDRNEMNSKINNLPKTSIFY